MIEPGTLYLVATPIGNLGDISRRALETLAGVDLVASESVATTRKLLSFHGISTPVSTYREAGRQDAGARLLGRLQEGGAVALVSEAGTPVISDPGRDLVARCRQAGIPVRCIPGPSALTCAVALSGVPARRLAFEGFLPRKGAERARILSALQTEERTVVLYVPPHQLRRTLGELAQALSPTRRAFLVREMTKRFEESLEASLEELLETYREREPRGEYVLLLAPEASRAEELPAVALEEEVRWLQRLGLGARQIAGVLSRYKGCSRREVYRRAHAVEESSGLTGRNPAAPTV